MSNSTFPWEEVTLTTKVFLRTDALEGLLKSVPDKISSVIIADDGDASERAKIYDGDWPFNIQVIDLEFDAGVGAGRAALVKELDTDYMLMVDPDHRVPQNIEILAQQLLERPDIGGIAGLLIEDNRISGGCHNFEESADGDILIRSAGDTEAETVAGFPLIQFDFVPQAALIRQTALTEYSWDPYYTSAKDHLDFMLGQWQTEWKWAVSPSVVFNHVDIEHDAYQNSRQDLVRWYNAKRYTLNKWGYDQIVFEETYAAFKHISTLQRIKQSIPQDAQRYLNDIGDLKNKYLGRVRRM